MTKRLAEDEMHLSRNVFCLAARVKIAGREKQAAHLEVQVGDTAAVQILEGPQDVPHVEGHLLLHQLIMLHEIIQQSAVIHPERDQIM